MIDELELFCRRVVADARIADELALAARRSGGARLDALAMAARLCRDQPDAPPPPVASAQTGAGAPGARTGAALAHNVAAELAAAIIRLPERQREALALRDGLRLSHGEIATVMAVEPAAVAPLLARARLRFRAARRDGEVVAVERCSESDRALRILVRGQDSEPLSAEDEDWLHVHLAGCDTCEMAHGALLEAATCYRVWPQ